MPESMASRSRITEMWSGDSGLPLVRRDRGILVLDQRQEQLVVRISSTVPFSKLWNDPGFTVLMEEIGRTFNLFAKLPPEAQDAPDGQRASLPGAVDEMRPR